MTFHPLRKSSIVLRVPQACKGWWAVYDDVLPTGFDVYVGLEAEAAALRVFEDQVVHGLLQTEAYARTVMTSVRRRQHTRQIERAVELRMERQRVLTRADPVKLCRCAVPG